MKLFQSILLIALAIVFLPSHAEQDSKKESNKDGVKNQLTIIQDEINDLVDQGGKYAYVQLARKNGMSPFAVGRQADGNVVILEIPKSEEKASFSEKVYTLRQMLRAAADAGRFVSAALFVHAQVPHQGKEVAGIAIEMEHKLGMSVLRFTPYEIDRDNKKIKFKKPVDKIKPSVFFASKQKSGEQAG